MYSGGNSSYAANIRFQERSNTSNTFMDMSGRGAASPKRELEFDPKMTTLHRTVLEMYNEIKTCAIDEISKSVHVDTVTLLEKDKKPVDVDAVVQGLKYFVNKLVKYHVSMKDINDRKAVRSNLTLGAEEALPLAEADLKGANREIEKLRLLMDTAHLKIKMLENKNADLINQTKKVASDTQNEKTKLKSYIRNQNDQLKQMQEESIINKRPTTTGSNSVRRIKDIKAFRDPLSMKERDGIDRSSFEVMHTAKSSNSLAPDSVKQISSHMEQNRLHNLQNKHELKELRRQAEIEREKELTVKQKDLLIARLNIQVDERDKDLNRLKSDYDKIFNELKKMKEKEGEREREEWSKEILSDKNPNLIEHYKKKLEEKKAMISFLKKQLRKYAISEKKVFIKEKVFELERAEYQDKMIYLQERVSKLTKIGDDSKKSHDSGKDKYRKRRETNLNKSQTSSDDDEQLRPTGGVGGINLNGMGLGASSYGKTPKVSGK